MTQVVHNPTATEHAKPSDPHFIYDLPTPTRLSVIRRNGTISSFNATRIALAITKAFWDVEGPTARESQRIHSIVQTLTEEVVRALTRRIPVEGGAIHIEDIQDQVELALMRNEWHKVARSYVLYREEHRKQREAKQAHTHQNPEYDLPIQKADGARAQLKDLQLPMLVTEACIGLQHVNSEALLADVLRNLYENISEKEVFQAIVMSARAFIEQEPEYSFLAARLLLRMIQQECLQFLRLPTHSLRSNMNVSQYATAFEAFVRRGIELDRLDPRLEQRFDLPTLGLALKPERDLQFNYLGLQTLYDRYFIHHEGFRFELPQVFFMRVAMGLALLEADPQARAIEFYELLSSFDYMSSTPTLFNAGTLHPQLSSCYLTTIPDDLAGIYNGIRDNALLSKFAGGLGNDWTQVRSMNAHIKGTNGKSQGVVPFLKVANDTAVAVNQGGKRKGAVCAYLETWHLDIEEFLELRKNTGDERRRTHDMNTANWIPDLFMKRVLENKSWTLFSPDEVPKLHDSYGAAFETAYEQYETAAAQGAIKHYKTLPAVQLWRKMLNMLFETGHPWITFKDPCNLRSPQQHVGVVHSSNLCTEITLNTSAGEIAVCNLGSVNLVKHLKEGRLDLEKLEHTVRTAVRMLDNVIDLNFYPVEQARNSNLKHRPVGLGIMGFQDALYVLDIPFASKAAVEFADQSMEYISYFALEASSELARERGSYSSFEGSLWSQGILPIDSIQLLRDNRDLYLDQDQSTHLDWSPLREKIKTVGLRNSNTMAIAPTATISNICGVSQSIEPTYQNLYVKSNLSGEFTIINPYLVRDLRQHGLWDDAIVKDLKYFNGSAQYIERIPTALKAKYATAFEIDPLWLIEGASRRQKWIDQSQSLNLYLKEPSGKKLDTLYRSAWLKGLKTCYYLRTLGATNPEKSTIHDGALNAVPVTATTCSIDSPDCEACQ